MEQIIKIKNPELATPELTAKAIEQLKSVKEYRMLMNKWQDARLRGDMIRQIQLDVKIKRMEADAVNNLTDIELRRRRDTIVIADVLREDSEQDYEKFVVLLGGLCFLLDLVEFTFHDINEILDRHKVGSYMLNFPELQKARDACEKMAGHELKKMPEKDKALWYDESDRLFGYLQQRSEIFCRKVGRISKKKKPTD
jgi:hypothetical protein